MYRKTLETHESRREIATPSWGAIFVFAIGAVFVPLSITVIVSYPTFGVGILTGMMLPYLVRTARRFGCRFSRHDLKTGLWQLGSKDSPRRRADGSSADG